MGPLLRGDAFEKAALLAAESPEAQIVTAR